MLLLKTFVKNLIIYSSLKASDLIRVFIYLLRLRTYIRLTGKKLTYITYKIILASLILSSKYLNNHLIRNTN